jgi:hypothetical protein
MPRTYPVGEAMSRQIRPPFRTSRPSAFPGGRPSVREKQVRVSGLCGMEVGSQGGRCEGQRCRAAEGRATEPQRAEHQNYRVTELQSGLQILARVAVFAPSVAGVTVKGFA